MPSLFEQLAASSLQPSMFGTFGLSATYTAVDGSSAVPCTIRLHRNESRSVDKSVRVSGELQSGEVMVRQSEIARPVKGGRFTIEGGVEVWSVASKPRLVNGQWLCAVERAGKERMGERRNSE